MFGSSSAMRTIGTYVVRFGGAEEDWICRDSTPRPSESSFVVKRCPSEIRSTSMATASSACSMRSSLLVTSTGRRGFLDSASIRREYARESGIPIAQMIAVAKAPRGTTISGPISVHPHGACAVRGYRKLYLRSLAQRARCRDGSIVCPHRLSRDRQTEAGAARLVGDVRLPDGLQTSRRDPFAVVGNRDPHRVPARHLHRSRGDGDAPLVSRRIDGVQQHVAERARQRTVVAEHAWEILVYPQIESNARRYAAARGVAHELAYIDLRRRTLRQPA